MKHTLSSNRGATLIELITAIAILSIVSISCFTLLMFSIRTNSFITLGTNACRDAELLNIRLEAMLKDAEVKVSIENDSLEFIDEKQFCYSDGEQLCYDGTLIQENVTNFKCVPIEGTNLIRITYTIDERYTSTKIFACAKVIADESTE